MPRLGRYRVGIEGNASNVLKNGKNFSALRTFSRRDQLKASHLYSDGLPCRFAGGFARGFLDRLAGLGFFNRQVFTGIREFPF